MAVAKPYDVLVSQIWALLPGFCNNPTDLTESFKGMAKTLGETMQNMKELRVYILSSLRQLISKSRGKPEKETELARYAKNFLPIFFNIYTTQPGMHNAIKKHILKVRTTKDTLHLHFVLHAVSASGAFFNGLIEQCSYFTLR